MGGRKGEIFLTRPDVPWPPPSVLCNGNWDLPGSKVAKGVALTTHSHLELRIKKEQSYTSIAFLCFHSPFKVKPLPFTFSLGKHKDSHDNCEHRRNPAVSCTLCEQKRTRRSLGCGRVEGVGSPQTSRATFCTESRAAGSLSSWHRPQRECLSPVAVLLNS